jgi:hypothetical protein
LVSWPEDGTAFVAHVRDWLDGIVQATDEAFPENKSVRIENGEAIITPPHESESASVRDLEARLAQYMPEQHIPTRAGRSISESALPASVQAPHQEKMVSTPEAESLNL